MNIVKIDNLKLNAEYSSFDKVIILSENNIIDTTIDLVELNRLLASDKETPVLGKYIFIQAESDLHYTLNSSTSQYPTLDIIQYLQFQKELTISRNPTAWGIVPVTNNVSKSFYLSKINEEPTSLIINSGLITKFNVNGNKALQVMSLDNQSLLDIFNISELQNPNTFKSTNNNTLIKYFIVSNKIKNVLYIFKDFKTGNILWPYFHEVDWYINTQPTFASLTNYYFLNYLGSGFTQAEIDLAQSKNIKLISLS